MPRGSSPRMRGTLRADDHGQRILGIIPRMRGTPHTDRREWRTMGIIPAYAGNTRAFRRSWLLPWDHPRVCGEHSDGWSVMRTDVGSSPRMRGTPAGWARGTRSRGIIPAYAGNTIRCLSARRATVDHPRVCGEHLQPPAQPE